MYDHLYEKAIQLIPAGARVLDLGSGDGTFLHSLVRSKNVQCEGVEKEAEMVARCIEKGLVVHQGDVLDGLDQHHDDTFDFVLMLGTFQELVSPRKVLLEALRVGRRIMVAYHNFSYWEIRFKLLYGGKVPITRSMPHIWYESPNLHFCSILDFRDLLANLNLQEEKAHYFNSRGEVFLYSNFRAEEVLSMISRDPGKEKILY